jgi:methylated-DNA-[protein]-cysteine S-methyltransferase
MTEATQTLRMTSPVGELELVAQAGELTEIHWEPQRGDIRRAAGDGRRTPADQPTDERRRAEAHQPADDGARARSVADHETEQADLEVLDTAQSQLEAYFAGSSDSFVLPTRRNGTEFQLTVWGALREIGYGETITYGELATRIGRPRAARAVGQALARNPLPIVVPCHRVVGHLGELTGFGGGIERKRLLLDLESR